MTKYEKNTCGTCRQNTGTRCIMHDSELVISRPELFTPKHDCWQPAGWFTELERLRAENSEKQREINDLFDDFARVMDQRDSCERWGEIVLRELERLRARVAELEAPQHVSKKKWIPAHICTHKNYIYATNFAGRALVKVCEDCGDIVSEAREP